MAEKIGVSGNRTSTIFEMGLAPQQVQFPESGTTQGRTLSCSCKFRFQSEIVPPKVELLRVRSFPIRFFNQAMCRAGVACVLPLPFFAESNSCFQSNSCFRYSSLSISFIIHLMDNTAEDAGIEPTQPCGLICFPSKLLTIRMSSGSGEGENRTRSAFWALSVFKADS